MTRFLVPVVALAVSAFGAYPAAAQEWSPEPGDRAIQFGADLFGGGESGSVGLWWQRAERRAFGLAIDVEASYTRATGHDDGRDQTTLSLSIGPRWKVYREATGAVSPFVLFGARAGGSYGRSGDDDVQASYWGTHLAGEIGFGVDWFPADHLSIGGHTGLGLRWSYSNIERTTARSLHSIRLDSFTSALMVQWYF